MHFVEALKKKPIWLAAVAVGSLIVLSGCSAGTSGAGTASGQAAGAGGPTTSQLAELKTMVDKYSAVPQFKAPGPAFDVSSLAGKKVMVMPLASQIPACEGIAKNIVSLSESLGMKATLFDNSGGSQGWIPGVQQATSQKYDALVFTCGIEPDLIKPQIQAAQAAGVAVIDSGLGEVGTPNNIVTASTNLGEEPVFGAAIAAALVAAKGKPIHFLEVTANDIPTSAPEDKVFRDLLSKYCSACQVKSINVAVPDWGTKIQPAVSSALLADPKISVVVPIFDSMFAPVNAAIKGSANKQVGIYGAIGGTPELIAQIGTTSLMTDVGSSESWRSYTTADQMFRVVSGSGAVSPDAEADGMRLFTSNNYKESASANGGYGDAFPAGYRSLWLKK